MMHFSTANHYLCLSREFASFSPSTANKESPFKGAFFIGGEGANTIKQAELTRVRLLGLSLPSPLSGPALRAVQNRSRRFCRTQLFYFHVSSNLKLWPNKKGA
jgi:hypothetical protein